MHDGKGSRPGAAWRRLAALVLMALAPLAARATIPPVVNGQPVPSLAPMLAQVTPAVVNISSESRVMVNNPMLSDPVFSQLFGDVPRERVEKSLGSGVIVDADKGYILTNNHVIAGADRITVTLKDGRSFKASVVGADPDTDIAVIRIDASHLTALKMADSSKLRVGDFVVAVGDPFGLGQTVTSGIVSALRRNGLGHTYQNFIQTDASINPGNSGGALVNLKGELVGINSMIYSPSGASAGIGFAIPTNLAREVMDQLLKYGKVRRGSLGIQVQRIDAHIARALDVNAGRGVVVSQVQPGSPAAKAGLQPGDVLLSVNGQALHDAQDLHNEQGLLPVGTPVTMKVQRNGHSLTLHTTVEPERLASVDGAQLDPRLAGVTLRDVPRDQRISGSYGVAVTDVDPDSDAAAAGLQRGDMVVAVDQQPVTDVASLRRMLDPDQPPQQMLLSVVRGQQVFYLLVR